MINRFRAAGLVICFLFVQICVFAENPSATPVEGAPAKIQIPTVCAVAQFGDPNVAGTPLFSSATSSLAQDAQGNIYSTTPDGGKYRRGAAYKVAPDGTMTILYDFGQALKNYPKKDPKDPDVYLLYPSGGLVESGNGNFIGVSGGGALNVGAIFSISADGGEPSILWSFRNGYPARKLNPGEKDYTPQEKLDWAASYPMSSPVKIGGGFYGVTPYANNQGYGIFYVLGGGYEGKYFFKGENGLRPWTMITGDDGQLFGISAFGRTKETAYMGTVFAADPGGGVSFLHEGTLATGYSPKALVYGSDKQLYVAMAGGGAGGGQGFGLIARIDPKTRQYEVIHEFDGKKGWYPSTLAEGPDGRLYGTTLGGGHCGAFFSLTRYGADFKLMFKFDHGRIGHRPHGPLLVDKGWKYIYGTTYQVSEFGGGSLYRVDPPFGPRRHPGIPGRRWCCSLAQSPGSGFSGGSLDPGELAGHNYGATDGWTNVFDISDTRDPVGFVATAYGGLVDIGHVRYTADLTKYVYELLIQGEYLIPLFEGNAQIYKTPADQYAALQLAGAIAYHEAWAHEFGSWKQTHPPQDFSSFSPEDLSSNMVGIEVAKRAIIDSCGKEFDKAMDEQLFKVLMELKAQPKEVTAKIREDLEQSNFNSEIKGKWFSEFGPSEKLLRRNFEPWPWRVVEDVNRTVHPMFNFNWVVGIQLPNFGYEMKARIIGHEMKVTSYNMKAAAEVLKKEWVTKDKGLATWP